MISEEKYIELIENVLGITLEDNLDQKKSILSPINENQYIVAGPGSGKTTVLVLKILKYIFVDNIKLENILVTTFTKKAARELKERISNWTLMLSEELGISQAQVSRLEKSGIDNIKRIIIYSFYFF